MADKKPSANPDKDLTWDQLIKKLAGQAEGIIKALDPLARINRDADGKEQKPITDLAGQSRQTAMALKSDYTAQMREYGGSPDLGIEISSDTTVLRRKLAECLKLAEEIRTKVHDADSNLDTLAEVYAKANQPKIAARIAREEAAAQKTAERIAKLKQAASGSGRKRSTATA